MYDYVVSHSSRVCIRLYALSCTPYRLRPTACALPRAPYRVRPTACALPRAPYRVRPTACALPRAPYRVRPTACALPRAPYRVRPTVCALPCAPYRARHTSTTAVISVDRPIILFGQLSNLSTQCLNNKHQSIEFLAILLNSK